MRRHPFTAREFGLIFHRTIPVQTTDMKVIEHLGRSAARPAFQQAIEIFLATGRPGPRLRFNTDAPPIKVARVVTRLLEAHPELEIEEVEIRGHSACELFAGQLRVRTPEGEYLVEFEWNCRWKAEELGWVDYFGLPDQSRAAREFDHDCFRIWESSPVQLVAEVRQTGA